MSKYLKKLKKSHSPKKRLSPFKIAKDLKIYQKYKNKLTILIYRSF